jgi:hypothetical protein
MAVKSLILQKRCPRQAGKERDFIPASPGCFKAAKGKAGEVLLTEY